jgi:cytochrome d ubiquinol oxidase subunit I
MLMASALTVAFLLAGMSAWRWLRGDRAPSVLAVLRTGIVMAAVGAPTQLLLGDMHGLNTLEHQPAKVAAMEGNWETRGNVPLVLFAIPDQAARENRFEIAIPSGASLILTHRADGEVPGLNQFRGEHPPVAPVFYAFRVMVGTGMLMIGFGLLGAWFLWRRGMVPRLMLWGLVGMTFAGWVATLAGWYVTEIGRQPWLVHGVLTTAQAAGPVPAGSIATTLVMYLVLYALLLAAYVGTLYRLAARAGGAAEPLPKGLPA